MIPEETKEKKESFDFASLLKEEFRFSTRTFFAPIVAIAQAFGKQFHEAEKLK
jgi:hypothetical protein